MKCNDCKVALLSSQNMNGTDIIEYTEGGSMSMTAKDEDNKPLILCNRCFFRYVGNYNEIIVLKSRGKIAA